MIFAYGMLTLALGAAVVFWLLLESLRCEAQIRIGELENLLQAAGHDRLLEIRSHVNGWLGHDYDAHEALTLITRTLDATGPES